MAEMKNLAKQTAIYGISSILGKFLNWCLVPLYTYVLRDSAEYGIVTNIYAWTALLLVILTYGMETGFFRFANKEGADSMRVYGTSLICLGITSSLFALCGVVFSPQISSLLGYGSHPEFVAMMCIIVSLDAFGAIPFAYIRYTNKSVRFAMLKLIMILANIFFNIFFLVICPKLQASAPGLIDWFYDADYGVGYVFVSNLFSTLLVTLLLIPDMLKAKFILDRPLLRKILSYSLPLLVLGVAGIMNQTLDKILFPYLVEDWAEGQKQLGIYGACFKVAMVMMVFTQAFRYAYEPFVFAQNKGGDKRGEYADAMKFFIIFSLLIFLGMMYYLDILKHIIHSRYWEGLRVVPIILMSYLFQGIFFNLSLWYKLVDKTQYGAYFSLLGLAITLAINILFVPEYGYYASAVASLCCYFVMMIVSYIYGQKYYPISYDLKSIFLYFAVALVLFGVSRLIPQESAVLKYVANTVMLFLFLTLVFKRDLPLSAVPVIGKFARRK